MIIDMTEKKINLSKKLKKADLCQVCIGCGRCKEIHQDLHVLVNFRYKDSTLYTEHKSREMEGCSDVFGIGIDLGTTTIAMSLADGAGRCLKAFCKENPQIIYGSDVLSRIRNAENREKAVCMQREVRKVLEQGCKELLKQVPADSRVQVVLAANTTMNYLLMGWAPDELGQSPFTVRHREPIQTQVASQAVWGFPPLSAFVGGDILAGIYSCGIHQRKSPVLLIDLGTNGEIVLGNSRRILACSTAAGPAFEGGPCRGIWGADMVHLIGTLLRNGLVDETGLLTDEYFEQGVTIGGVTVTQDAIRALQLAKAAIAAGVDILLAHFGITAHEVEEVILAGGLGYYLQPEDAALIGLLPGELAGKAVAGGNTSLQGAIQMSTTFLQGRQTEVVAEIKRIDELVEIMELPENSAFQNTYINHLNF